MWHRAEDIPRALNAAQELSSGKHRKTPGLCLMWRLYRCCRKQLQLWGESVWKGHNKLRKGFNFLFNIRNQEVQEEQVLVMGSSSSEEEELVSNTFLSSVNWHRSAQPHRFNMKSTNRCCVWCYWCFWTNKTVFHTCTRSDPIGQ